MTIESKTLLLTGATGGIGRALVKAFIQEGYKVAASGTNSDKLAELKAEYGSQIITLEANLGDHQAVKSLVDEAYEGLGGTIDILIANAGITKDNLSLMMKPEEWNQVINLNLTSVFLLNQAVIKKAMLPQKNGSIINIASVVASIGNPGQANYVAAKAGLIGLSKTLAREYATRNIRVNSLSPGFIESPMTDKLSQGLKDSLIKSIPLQRMGSPDEIAHAAVFLASDKASYITGHNLHVNGGLFME
jgi:3-oxoacyl-[acyl-carrier protein] reductase